ncbi:MAG: hypothetical protein KGL43_04600 [Burkholderiales bacterium]|nr:hypothetical protein [Burkholderiales bacterium]MDE2452852.1 hypothetical protein [Burkholderiales bacterium]
MNAAQFVKVYSFQLYETQFESPLVAPYKAPLDLIQALGGSPLKGTDEDVPAHDLDEQGRFRRVATGWGELS